MNRILYSITAAILLSASPTYAGNKGDSYKSSGFYIGGVAAYATADYAVKGKNGDVAGKSYDFDSTGVIGGFKAGYLYKLGSISVGAEGEILGASLDSQKNNPILDDDDEQIGQTAVGDWAGTDWLGSIQARIQTNHGPIKPYVTAGVAFQKLRYGSAREEIAFTGSTNQTGYTVGAGVNISSGQALTLDIGYQFYRFEDEVDLGIQDAGNLDNVD